MVRGWREETCLQSVQILSLKILICKLIRALFSESNRQRQEIKTFLLNPIFLPTPTPPIEYSRGYSVDSLCTTNNYSAPLDVHIPLKNHATCYWCSPVCSGLLARPLCCTPPGLLLQVCLEQLCGSHITSSQQIPCISKFNVDI